MKYSDFELIDRAISGNRWAFEELVNRYKKSVYSLTYRMVHDYEDAADLAQETFLKTYLGLRRFKKRASFHTWLYRITINLCINHLRRTGTRQFESLDQVQLVKHPDVLDQLAQEEVRNMVNTAVNALPEKQRAAVILRIYHGLSHKEISDVLECSVGTVKANYFHAIRNLRKALHDHVGIEEKNEP